MNKTGRNQETRLAMPPESASEDERFEDSQLIGSNSVTAPPEVLVKTPNLIGETPGLDKAVADLEDFECDFDPQNVKTRKKEKKPEEKKPAVAAPQGFMMFLPQAVAAPPTLKMEAWPHKGQKPTPITMGKA